jgi:uncharacterized FlaG/YvyC family protein
MDISSVNSLLAGVGLPTDANLPPPATADQRALIQAVKAVNSTALLGSENELTFVRDRTTNLPAVRIINKDTGDVVAQIPAEDVLQMAEEVSGNNLTTSTYG